MAIELEARRIKQRRDYTIPVRLGPLVGALDKVEAIELISETKQKPKMMTKPRSWRRSHRLLLLALVLASSHLHLLGRCDTPPGPQATRRPAKGAAASKESLLSSLAQTIELQHFKSAGNKQPARLSKFDASAQDNSYLDLQAPASKGSRLGQDAEPDGMSQILRMHESANLKPPQQQQQQAPGAKQDRFKRWRSVWPPQRSVAANLIKPNKMVHQVLSYITPLVGGKLTQLKLHQFAGRSFAPDDFGAPAAKTGARSTKSYTGGEPSGLAEASSRKQSASYSLDASDDEIKDLMADSSSLSSLISPLSAMMMASEGSPPADPPAAHGQPQAATDAGDKPADDQPATTTKASTKKTATQSGKRPSKAAGWLRQSANQVAQNYFQNSFRDLITLSQLPILSASTISTAPSVLEKKQSQPEAVGAPGGPDKNKRNKKNKRPADEFRRRAMEELYRYAYILATGVRNKKDPLTALASKPSGLTTALANYHTKGLTTKGLTTKVLSQRSINQLVVANQTQLLNLVRKLRSLLSGGPLSRARPRGVMWDMATDPSLAVTVFHLLERASVALPLGFMLMPVIQMMRNPQLNGLNFGRLLPARASHRSVDYEELAKRLDVVDKILSRALRQTHREGIMGK